MTGNGFDNLEELRIPAEHIATKEVDTPTLGQRREERFIMIPLPWIDQISKTPRREVTIFVALYLLHLAWKSKGAPVTLSKWGLTEWGISRRGKWRALRELVALGLIAIEQLNRKSPQHHAAQEHLKLVPVLTLGYLL